MRRKVPVIEYQAPDSAEDDSVPPRDYLRILVKIALTSTVLVGIAILLWLLVRVAYRIKHGVWYWD